MRDSGSCANLGTFCRSINLRGGVMDTSAGRPAPAAVHWKQSRIRVAKALSSGCCGLSPCAAGLTLSLTKLSSGGGTVPI
jgi:hypothetical protein